MSPTTLFTSVRVLVPVHVLLHDWRDRCTQGGGRGAPRVVHAGYAMVHRSMPG